MLVLGCVLTKLHHISSIHNAKIFGTQPYIFGLHVEQLKGRGSLYSCCSTPWKSRSMKHTTCTNRNHQKCIKQVHFMSLWQRVVFPTFFFWFGGDGWPQRFQWPPSWLDIFSGESTEANTHPPSWQLVWSLMASWLDLPKEVHRKSLTATWLKRNITCLGCWYLEDFWKVVSTKGECWRWNGKTYWVWLPSQYSGKWMQMRVHRHPRLKM